MDNRSLSSAVEIKILPPSDLELVRRFLFWTYCVVDGWMPPADDLAGFRVEGNRLLDDRDHLCIHFIAWLDGEILGCIRIAPRVSGKFETQFYDKANSDEDYARFDFELARFSVAPAARKTVIGLKLMEAAARWAVDRNVFLFAAPVESAVQLSYRKVGYKPYAGMKTFRYHEEESPATIFGSSYNVRPEAVSGEDRHGD